LQGERRGIDDVSTIVCSLFLGRGNQRGIAGRITVTEESNLLADKKK
jgi:hypothetical protein